MPGRLRTSFRSGNLAEQLGLLLLRGIAAVADVPRTEDVGFLNRRLRELQPHSL